jgi:hypothetical protein
VIWVQLFLSRSERDFDFWEESTRWRTRIAVEASIDPEGRRQWVIQSIGPNNIPSPKSDGSKRDRDVLALLNRLIEIGVGGRVEPEELVRFERTVDSDPPRRGNRGQR